MTKVHIVEKFNTSIGNVLLIEDKCELKVGERIECDDGSKHVIKGIQMGTRPTDSSRISLIVD